VVWDVDGTQLAGPFAKVEDASRLDGEPPNPALIGARMDLDATADKLEEAATDIICLRRLTGRGCYIEVTCPARITKWVPEMLRQIAAAGGIAQGDSFCIISNREIERRHWPGPPRRGDVVVILGEKNKVTTATVQGCSSSSYQGRVIRHDLQICGN
jgi:hypothetical protein